MVYYCQFNNDRRNERLNRIEIPITRPHITADEERAVAEVLRSGWLTQGDRVSMFERAVAGYVGGRHAVATSSCTTALFIALKLAGVGKDDEVILPSYTFVATANVIIHAGARPVFVDIDPETYNIDPARVEEKIGDRTKVIMPVHQVGLPADMDPLKEIAHRHGLIVIEDAACALGSEYKGERIGGGETITCLSFHPRKVVTTGEGGMVLLPDADIEAEARSLISHGESIPDIERHRSAEFKVEQYRVIGYNFRMTNLQGAVGVVQMKKIDWISAQRRGLAERYNAAFERHPFIIPPGEPPYARTNFQSYMVRLGHDCPVPRDQVIQFLRARGVSARRGVQAIHREPAYVELLGEISLPETEHASDSTIILPLFPQMSRAEQDHVIEALARLGQDQ